MNDAYVTQGPFDHGPSLYGVTGPSDIIETHNIAIEVFQDLSDLPEGDLRKIMIESTTNGDRCVDSVEQLVWNSYRNQTPRRVVEVFGQVHTLLQANVSGQNTSDATTHFSVTT